MRRLKHRRSHSADFLVTTIDKNSAERIDNPLVNARDKLKCHMHRLEHNRRFAIRHMAHYSLDFVNLEPIAMGQVARPLRVANIALGVWLTASPLVFSGYSAIASVALAVAGLALIGLALPPGRITTHFGEWDRLIGRPFLRRSALGDGVRPRWIPADDTTARTR